MQFYIGYIYLLCQYKINKFGINSCIIKVGVHNVHILLHTIHLMSDKIFNLPNAIKIYK